MGRRKNRSSIYRKGARFERVRDNFVRFARMKQERKSKVQIVVQMVRMERNWNEVDEFIRFWRAVPGVDQVRIKADETNLMRPDRGHAAAEWKHPCHYLWRGPMYVKHNGDVYPCCQSYMLACAPVGNIGSAIVEGDLERRADAAACDGCTLPDAPARSTSARVAARRFRTRSRRRKPDAPRPHRSHVCCPVVERLVYLSKLPGDC